MDSEAVDGSGTVRCVGDAVACTARPGQCAVSAVIDWSVTASRPAVSDSASERVTWVSRRLCGSWHAAHHPRCCPAGAWPAAAAAAAAVN